MTVTSVELVLRSLDPSWSYARWEELPDDGNRYEVIDGVLYMTTAPSFFHQWVVQRLVRLIGIPAEDRGLAYFSVAPIGLLMPGCDPVQPDFLLVRQANAGIIADRRIRGVPDLIAEVLSPSNPEQDTEIKRDAYARAGVPEYWIIRPQTRDILLCWQPDATLGDYAQVRLIGQDDDLASPTLDGVVLRVADLFAGAPDTTL
ncbi:Uma2 family endonuclease [Chloroflexales bacterium ZM16-3]|nr:Uma2 family endonuclease [Chloroflexales bacterium ZM16-3]